MALSRDQVGRKRPGSEAEEKRRGTERYEIEASR